MSPTPHHARHHGEELSLGESDPRAVCPVTAVSSKERPHTSPSLIPISDNLNCQKSSSSKIFTLRYFFTLSVQVFVHQKQWISCYSFSCFEFSEFEILVLGGVEVGTETLLTQSPARPQGCCQSRPHPASQRGRLDTWFTRSQSEGIYPPSSRDTE